MGKCDSAAAAAKSLQSCPTLCDSIDGSPSGSPIPGIHQARTLEWVAISSSHAWKWKWSHSVVSYSSRPHGLQPTRLLHPWHFPGKSTGVLEYLVPLPSPINVPRYCQIFSEGQNHPRWEPLVKQKTYEVILGTQPGHKLGVTPHRVWTFFWSLSAFLKPSIEVFS